MKKTIAKINEHKRFFFEKIKKKVMKLQPDLTKKREKMQLNEIRIKKVKLKKIKLKLKGEVTTEVAEI